MDTMKDIICEPLNEFYASLLQTVSAVCIFMDIAENRFSKDTIDELTEAIAERMIFFVNHSPEDTHDHLNVRKYTLAAANYEFDEWINNHETCEHVNYEIIDTLYYVFTVTNIEPIKTSLKIIAPKVSNAALSDIIFPKILKQAAVTCVNECGLKNKQ